MFTEQCNISPRGFVNPAFWTTLDATAGVSRNLLDTNVHFRVVDEQFQ